MASPIPVTMTQPSPMGGGLLEQALALPDGWERGGIAFEDPNCLAPTVMGQCPTSDEELKPTDRVGQDEFRTYELIQAVECTAMGATDVSQIAESELARTRSFALAREMLTGFASARDTKDTITPNPSLAGTATSLGADFPTVAASLGCLEASLAALNSGRGGFILAPIAWATQALAERVIWRDGARWRTVTGAPVIIDAGFDGRAPGSALPPAAGAPLYAYATTAVWAGVGRSDTIADMNRGVNTNNARAEQVGLAAFSTCAVVAAASSAATAC